LGLFPERLGANVRIGSFVSQEWQAEYARDQRKIAADLRSVNFEAFDGGLLARLQALAGLPYQLELQLDATKGGVGKTIGVDLTLAMHSTARVREAFAKGGDAARACTLLESWGVCDGRWRLVTPLSLCHMVPLPNAHKRKAALLMSCLPSFIKAKWTDGQPQPAKVYFQCSIRPFALS
jgi:hypothetical protein